MLNKHFFNALLILALVGLFVSCGIMKPMDFTNIKVGMNQQEVIQKIGKPNLVVASKKYNDGVLEIYEYITGSIDSTHVKRSWLHFFNNELQEWGPKENYSPNDYDEYYRRYRHKH
ncbi:MAG: hypothetical protein K0R59_3517 [Sphingobacterium sp.]|jgi:hypothetical protein|uniref:hypothetical protein n=1 Tax=unclassified Sphingobacterium TaxID=2609468 RepID=UPI00098736DD|nr:hypothetical protein [Sphingobacterium sp. CZ-UAM]MDF2518221.1 hypothetical protein [Sphingobacterium sp.]OOG16552.1 hypothetical protein BWD42_20170 [Sphingobacterium sp. CZ-UAM]